MDKYPDGREPAATRLEVDGLVDELLVEIAALSARERWYLEGFTSANAVSALLDLPREDQPDAVLAVLHRAAGRELSEHHILQAVAGRILRRRLPWSDAQIVDLTVAVMELEKPHFLLTGPHAGLSIGTIARHIEAGTTNDLLRQTVQTLITTTRHVGNASRATLAQTIERLDVALSGRPARTLGADPWARAIQAEVDQHSDAGELQNVLQLAATAKAAKPTAKFTADLKVITSQFGPGLGDAVADLLSRAVTVPQPETPEQIPPRTGDLLRGLVWIAAAAAGARAATAIGDVAIACWRKVPGMGPLCQKAANAAVTSLASMRDGAPQLGRVRAFLKQPRAVEQVDHAIEHAAAALGIPAEQFAERVVPDMGLAEGAAATTLGDFTADLTVDIHGAVALTFRRSNGTALRGVPAAVRTDFAAELADLRRQANDIKAMVGAQRNRIEMLMRDERIWRVADWHACYWGHGLVGPLIRSLLWEFDLEGNGDWVAVLWRNDAWVNAEGHQVPITLSERTRVRLWHPATAGVDAVHAWRLALERWEVRQPFKQAHREIYVLTEAERATHTYSNRFAAHVVKQHQMAALCRARGWRYTLQGAWDTPDSEATLNLAQHGVDVRFWVERPWDQVDAEWAISEAGVFTVVTTDQVQFVERSTGEARDLEEIPPRVFSEVMRDVDLFVGVCSIGNDENWLDHAEARPYGDYWQSYAFGDLGPLAATRAEVLERLIPKLAIRDVARVDGRFLCVQGVVRNYRIHLGSTNILMEPNDQYLCIVPGRDPNVGRLYLPFDGDHGLAVILSKAMMLAQDDQIRDPTITMQINGHAPPL